LKSEKNQQLTSEADEDGDGADAQDAASKQLVKRKSLQQILLDIDAGTSKD